MASDLAVILHDYAHFRHHFAEVARTIGVSLTYAAGPPATISRGAGSFVTDGYVAGMNVDPSGTASNDGRYTIDTVAALTLTLSADDTLSPEVVTSSLTGATYYVDGYETWPRDNVRAGGFSDTWNLLPRPITGFPAQLTVNSLVDDVTAGTSYVWYVRQRTDDVAKQWLSVTHADPASTGTIALSLTAKCATDIGAVDLTKLTIEQQRRILRNVWVFVKRLSDGAIQQADLFQLSHGTVL